MLIFNWKGLIDTRLPCKKKIEKFWKPPSLKRIIIARIIQDGRI
jgi:hypothetical protein